MTELPIYILLDEVVQRIGISQEALTRAIANGTMKAIKMPDGRILVSASDLAALEISLAALEISREQFAPLEGQKISLQGASRKYGVPPATLHSWLKQGLISLLVPGQHRGRPLALNEADVAFRAAIYHRVKGERGSVVGLRLFRQSKRKRARAIA